MDSPTGFERNCELRSGCATWHQVTKLSPHALSMAVAAFWSVWWGYAVLLTIACVAVWGVAWPKDEAGRAA